MSEAAGRERLPNRREALTETIQVGQNRYDAAIGFDPATGNPREIFLSGAKDGTDMAAILADTSVVVSIALQHGIAAAELAHSIARVPTAPDAPATAPASVIGAALDLLLHYEREEWRVSERPDIRDLITHPSVVRDVLDDYATALGVAGELAVERKRQIVGEGYSLAHDDAHGAGELSRAAASFALLAAASGAVLPHEVRRWAWLAWPFDVAELRKKRSPRRMLVIAGALILAEIERLDRASNGEDAAINSPPDQALP